MADKTKIINMRTDDDEMEIDLLELLFYMLKKWYFLLLGMILGALLLGVYTYVQPEEYQSESMIFVLSETTSITSLADLQIGSELSEDFLVISNSKPVLDTGIASVEEELGITLTREEVLEMLEVTADSDRILTITVVSEDPELSYCLTNSVTDAICYQIAEIMKSDPPTVIESAEIEEALDKGMLKNMIIGALAGFVVLACIVLIPHLLDNKIKTPDDVERYLDVPLLGIIPMDKSIAYEDKKIKRRNNKKKDEADENSEGIA